MNIKTTKANLLLVDPQRCFTQKTGALYVPNAEIDMVNIANVITAYNECIASIAITGDFHPTNMISFPNYWVNENGEFPAVFSVISVADVENGVWKTADPANQEWALFYVRQLEQNNKTKNNNFFELRIWPYHAIAGTEGANFDPIVLDALALYMNGKVTVVMKGMNPHTEQQGALEADVPVPGDAQTTKNTMLANWIDNAIDNGGDIIAGGEALDICFAYTIYSILNYLPVDKHNRLVVLVDCASPIYPELGRVFINDMETKFGVRVTTSTEYFAGV
jgi:nicotinamidase/pyrazinamidase